jgi:hypothetical protein
MTRPRSAAVRVLLACGACLLASLVWSIDRGATTDDRGASRPVRPWQRGVVLRDFHVAEGLFIVGDVHGCVRELETLVERSWNPKKQRLVVVGDVTLKGARWCVCRRLRRRLALFTSQPLCLRDRVDVSSP